VQCLQKFVAKLTQYADAINDRGRCAALMDSAGTKRRAC
jgi:hypothetical protein